MAWPNGAMGFWEPVFNVPVPSVQPPASAVPPPQQIIEVRQLGPLLPGPQYKRGRGRSFFRDPAKKGAVCQVPGCDKSLHKLREYYKRYKICPFHLELPCLVVEGQSIRFCQQCGRYQLLSDFDGDRRSCRRKLVKHNARRRKMDHLVEGVAGSNALAYGHGNDEDCSFKEHRQQQNDRQQCSDGGTVTDNEEQDARSGAVLRRRGKAARCGDNASESQEAGGSGSVPSRPSAALPSASPSFANVLSYLAGDEDLQRQLTPHLLQGLQEMAVSAGGMPSEAGAPPTGSDWLSGLQLASSSSLPNTSTIPPLHSQQKQSQLLLQQQQQELGKQAAAAAATAGSLLHGLCGSQAGGDALVGLNSALQPYFFEQQTQQPLGQLDMLAALQAHQQAAQQQQQQQQEASLDAMRQLQYLDRLMQAAPLPTAQPVRPSVSAFPLLAPGPTADCDSVLGSVLLRQQPRQQWQPSAQHQLQQSWPMHAYQKQEGAKAAAESPHQRGAVQAAIASIGGIGAPQPSPPPSHIRHLPDASGEASHQWLQEGQLDRCQGPSATEAQQDQCRPPAAHSPLSLGKHRREVEKCEEAPSPEAESPRTQDSAEFERPAYVKDAGQGDAVRARSVEACGERASSGWERRLSAEDAGGQDSAGKLVDSLAALARAAVDGEEREVDGSPAAVLDAQLQQRQQQLPPPSRQHTGKEEIAQALMSSQHASPANISPAATTQPALLLQSPFQATLPGQAAEAAKDAGPGMRQAEPVTVVKQEELARADHHRLTWGFGSVGREGSSPRQQEGSMFHSEGSKAQLLACLEKTNTQHSLSLAQPTPSVADFPSAVSFGDPSIEGRHPAASAPTPLGRQVSGQVAGGTGGDGGKPRLFHQHWRSARQVAANGSAFTRVTPSRPTPQRSQHVNSGVSGSLPDPHGSGGSSSGVGSDRVSSRETGSGAPPALPPHRGAFFTQHWGSAAQQMAGGSLGHGGDHPVDGKGGRDVGRAGISSPMRQLPWAGLGFGTVADALQPYSSTTDMPAGPRFSPLAQLQPFGVANTYAPQGGQVSAYGPVGTPFVPGSFSGSGTALQAPSFSSVPQHAFSPPALPNTRSPPGGTPAHMPELTRMAAALQQHHQQQQQQSPSPPQNQQGLAAGAGPSYPSAPAVGDPNPPPSTLEVAMYLVRAAAAEADPRVAAERLVGPQPAPGPEGRPIFSPELLREAVGLLQQVLSSGDSYQPSQVMVTASMKLYQCTPDQLPPNVRKELETWLANASTFLEESMRPGCVHLTVTALVDVTKASELTCNFGGKMQQLMSEHGRGTLGCAASGSALAQQGDQAVVLRDGKLLATLDMSSSASLAPDLSGLQPLAVTPEYSSTFLLTGHHISGNHDEVFCRHKGRYPMLAVLEKGPTEDACSPASEGLNKAAVEWVEFQMLQPLEVGTYQLEAQRGRFVSIKQQAFLVVPDQQAADELRQLEKDCMGIADVPGFLQQVGMILQYLEAAGILPAPASTPPQEDPVELLESPAIEAQTPPTSPSRRLSSEEPSTQCASEAVSPWGVACGTCGSCGGTNSSIHTPFFNAAVALRIAACAQQVAAACILRRWPALLRLLLPAVTGHGELSPEEAVAAMDICFGAGATVMHAAVAVGDLEIVRVLQQWGKNMGYCWRLDGMPGTGITPLHLLAILKDKGGLAVAITEMSPSGQESWVTAAAADGTTPIMLAGQLGNRKLLQALAKSGCAAARMTLDCLTPGHFRGNSGRGSSDASCSSSGGSSPFAASSYSTPVEAAAQPSDTGWLMESLNSDSDSRGSHGARSPKRTSEGEDSDSFMRRSQASGELSVDSPIESVTYPSPSDWSSEPSTPPSKPHKKGWAKESLAPLAPRTLWQLLCLPLELQFASPRREQRFARFHAIKLRKWDAVACVLVVLLHLVFRYQPVDVLPSLLETTVAAVAASAPGAVLLPRLVLGKGRRFYVKHREKLVMGCHACILVWQHLTVWRRQELLALPRELLLLPGFMWLPLTALALQVRCVNFRPLAPLVSVTNAALLLPSVCPTGTAALPRLGCVMRLSLDVGFLGVLLPLYVVGLLELQLRHGFRGLQASTDNRGGRAAGEGEEREALAGTPGLCHSRKCGSGGRCMCDGIGASFSGGAPAVLT